MHILHILLLVVWERGTQNGYNADTNSKAQQGN